MKFLLDENAEYFQKLLEKQNYETITAKKLKLEDPKYAHDYNLIEYAKEHSMIIITKDGELGETCNGNNFPCILISEHKIFEKIVQPEINDRFMENTESNLSDDGVLDAFNEIKSGEASRMSQKGSD
jgi:predicted nuclease of predicted toxin-antitoxin system